MISCPQSCSTNIDLTSPFDLITLKLSDFGCSRKLDDMMHQQDNLSLVGTPIFMAPEIFTGDYDKSVDVFALGKMMYHMRRGIYILIGEIVSLAFSILIMVAIRKDRQP